ncbi:MAG: HNH endonuclease [Candidatus Accumulibacter sp.]|uniref:HNH endonuclease n=1 Tax=Accumulibacter sp. TaxID=2053492 RepID=UPI001A5636EC|nr:HNH endonuclease signature motif containing protein [Accumulibacter sp.]MBL8395141.1 HNH endonuclease [Accumulibacter sp.]
MRIFFVNTDAVSFEGVSRHDDWLRLGVVVTGGEARYRDALSRIPEGALVLAYVNGLGVVAVGEAVSAEVLDVLPPETVNPSEPLEFHKKVAWLHDLRANPISRTELIDLLGQGPLQAVQEVNKGKDALLSRLRLLPAIPTTDPGAYTRLSSTLRSYGQVNRPVGTVNPRRTESTIFQFYRDPKVRAWTLQRARGCCELCNQPAPFLDEFREPYLESHHITTLASGGADSPENTAALCANCHRELHFGAGRLLKGDGLRSVIRAKEAEQT